MTPNEILKSIKNECEKNTFCETCIFKKGVLCGIDIDAFKDDLPCEWLLDKEDK